MAYFECIIGSASSGGDGASLIVTCSQNFAGKVITCTDGGDNTFTETCPSSSPYTVTFPSIPTGTYTISCVISGQTFSTTMTITDFTAILSDIPNGATVTPTDVIQTWLHCANIWDKTYTTINQVLSDTTTLLALISSNNAADYMARSTTWASSVCANSTAMSYIGNNNYCASKLLANSTWSNAICNSTYFESVLSTKIPTMTSNTTPSGIASSSSAITGYEAYKAMDGASEGSDNTGWIATGNTGTIAYNFNKNVIVKKAKIRPEGVNGSCKCQTYKYQAYNGNSWVDVSGELTFPVSATTSTVRYDDINATTYYQQYRVNILQGNGSNIGINAIQFYGRAQS